MHKTIFVFVALFAVLLLLGFVAFRQQEKTECYQWQQQAREYPQFTLAEWQAEQCGAYGIKIK